MKTRPVIYGALGVLVGGTVWMCIQHFCNEHPPLPNAAQASLVQQDSTVAHIPARKPIRPAVAAPVMPPKESLSAPVLEIVDSHADYLKRSDRIRAITGKLADADRQALYAFLLQKDPADTGQLSQTLKNEIMDALCSLKPPPTGLMEMLSDLYHDRGQDEVLRDYAVQHVAAFYRQMADAPGLDPTVLATGLSSAQSLLWEALSESDTSIAGTGLLGLTHLSQQGFADVDRAKIEEAAYNLATRNDVGELTKITAIQVCASLGVKDALTVALGAAQGGETASVKISGIGALGLLGGEDQIPFLNSLLTGEDNRLQQAARAALGRINLRLQQPARISGKQS